MLMTRLILAAVFLIGTSVLHAASISYSAFISCSNCVTVSLSWANEPTPISFAEVDDNFGNFLFGLNVGAPRTTGSIVPNPQTVSGLSPVVISIISGGGGNVATALSDGQFGVLVNEPVLGDRAILNLLDADRNIVDSTSFIATIGQEGGVPEPGGWSIAAMGLGVLVFCARRLHRKHPALR
jgi:hypothetical protein